MRTSACAPLALPQQHASVYASDHLPIVADLRLQCKSVRVGAPRVGTIACLARLLFVLGRSHPTSQAQLGRCQHRHPASQAQTGGVVMLTPALAAFGRSLPAHVALTRTGGFRGARARQIRTRGWRRCRSCALRVEGRSQVKGFGSNANEARPPKASIHE